MINSAKSIGNLSSVWRQIIIIGLFSLCLIPFSIEIKNTGVSVNYLYIFFPFIFLLPGLKRRLVFRREVLVMMFIYTFIYLLISPFEIFNLEAQSFRRLASYIVFVIPLTLSFIEFKPRDLYYFKMAILLACLFYGVWRLLLYVTISFNFDGFYHFLLFINWLESVFSVEEINSSTQYTLKRLIGSQRYGFILIFGFFIALSEPKLFFKSWTLIQRLVISLIIFSNCWLTYSRATIIALLLSSLYFIWKEYFSNDDFFNFQSKLSFMKIRALKILMLILVFALTLFLLYTYRDYYFFEYYLNRFVEPFIKGSETYFLMPNTSEGYRIYLYFQVIDYVSMHPFFGSNFQGLYLLYNQYNGVASTHNQYLDILLRVGIIGLSFWLYFLYRIFRFCKNDTALLYGFLGIIIYGFFHETFKLSQGSFVFAMLLSFSYSIINSNSKNYSR